MFDLIKDKINEIKLDWMIADNKGKALKVVRVAADLTMLASGVGQATKTVKTANKLYKYSKVRNMTHKAKYITTFTANAQKVNAINTVKNIATTAAVKATANIAENTINDNKENNIKGDIFGYMIEEEPANKEAQCKEKAKLMLETKVWNTTNVMEYLEEELNIDGCTALLMAAELDREIRIEKQEKEMKEIVKEWNNKY